MKDGLKICVVDNTEVNRLWNNELLYSMKDEEKVNRTTGELYKKHTKEYEGIIFRNEPHIPRNDNEGPRRLVITFKPHYWYNQDKHNANDFTVNQSIHTIQKFIDLFDLHDYSKFPVNNLEYGVNFVLPGYGKEVIGFNCYHYRNEFTRDENQQYSKKAKKFNPKTGIAQKYLTIKFYAKGFQFPDYCNPNTLRFEVHTKKSKKINRLGIFNIGDLLKPEIYIELKNDLLRSVGHTLIIDQNPMLANLNKKDSNLLTKYSNSGFWFAAINHARTSNFNEKKKTYIRLLDKTGLNINRMFKVAIEEKLNLLFEQNCNYSPLNTKSENRNHSPIDKGGMFTLLPSKLCPVTGLDISMQKPNSKLLSNTGLKHYEKEAPITFEKLSHTLLTGEENTYENDLYSRISKQIRNRYYNNSSRYNSTSQGKLF